MAHEDEAAPNDAPAEEKEPSKLDAPETSGADRSPNKADVEDATVEGASPSPPDASKTNQSRKEESPFSFKHFLKRDLSLPSTSTSYESTGAKPKIYSNTVHPSPARSNPHQDPRKDSKSSKENYAGSNSTSSNRFDSSSNNIDFIFNTPKRAEEKNSISEIENCDFSSFRRSHTSNDVLGVPSLPDFVQDHLLVEQAYLGSNEPFTVDFDNLPDFALGSNSNYDNAQSCRDGADNFNYDSCNSNASKIGNCRSVPLDLPSFAEDRLEINQRADRRRRQSPLDLPDNITLDLTDSLNHVEHSNSNQRLSFPLDLPRDDNPSVNEPLRLPDFLPAQASTNNTNQPIIVPSNRDELADERRRRTAAERDLRLALQTTSQLRRELKAAKDAEQNARRELLEVRTSYAVLAQQLKKTNRIANATPGTSTSASHSPPYLEDDKFTSKIFDSGENNVAKLKGQITQLKKELAITHRELNELRGNNHGMAESLNLAANTAENSLRELLSGLEQLRGLASSLNSH